jgi:uncharacterized protein YaaW (UPF0174 family)
MNQNFTDVDALLKVSLEKDLYQKLLVQVKKDFDLAGITIKINPDLTTAEVKSVLHEKIYFLLLEKLDEYHNLLYIADVPEKALKSAHEKDAVDAAREISFIILKRVFKKVWYRQKNNP